MNIEFVLDETEDLDNTSINSLHKGFGLPRNMTKRAQETERDKSGALGLTVIEEHSIGSGSS